MNHETEPRLDDEDRAVWDAWRRAAATHARTRAHARAVDRARRAAAAALEAAGPRGAAVMWSGGKDSTCLAHLVVVGLGRRDVPLVSEKDDLDYPGEEAYVRGLAAGWGARLEVLRPAVSPAAWLAAHAAELEPDGDLHSRAAGLSKACFYGLVEADNARRDVILLGLRAEESRGRNANRAARGLAYRRAPTAAHPAGLVVGQPLGDWRGLDVYAYAEAHGLDLLPAYRCVAFMHAAEPWRVRKSWWVPGAAGATGGVAWLRRYWPSLYARLTTWLPTARRLA